MADKPKTLEEAIERINALEQQNAKKDKITYENAQKALEAETQTLKQLELIKKKKDEIADSDKIITDLEKQVRESQIARFNILQKEYLQLLQKKELGEEFSVQDETKLEQLKKQTTELARQLESEQKEKKLKEEIKSLGNDILQNIKQQTLSLEQHIMKISVATGGYAAINSNIREAGRLSQAATIGTGITGEENLKALESLSSGFIGLTTNSAESISSMQVASAQLNKLGVDLATSTKGFDSLVNAMGKTPQQAAKIQESFVQMSAKNRLALGEVTKAFSENSSRFVGYGEQMTKVLDGLAEQSLKTGISINGLVKIAEGFDTFDDASKKVGNLNALLGGDYLNSIEMLTASDDERITLMKEAISMSGKQWESMERFEKKAIANAAGISDLNEASKMFGKTSLENTKQQAEAAQVQKTLAEQAESVSLATDKMKSGLNGLMIAVEPLVSGLIYLGSALSQVIRIMNFVFSWGGSFPTFGAIATSVILFIATKASLLGKAFGYVGSKIGNIFPKIKQFVTGAESAAKSGETISSSLRTVGQAAKEAAIGILAIGAAALMIGGGIGLAALGMSKLVASFKDLTGILGGLASITLLMFGFILIIGKLGAVSLLFTAPIAGLAGALMAIGAAAALIGAGIGAAAAGIGYMVNGVANLVVALDNLKTDSVSKLLDIFSEENIEKVNNFASAIAKLSVSMQSLGDNLSAIELRQPTLKSVVENIGNVNVDIKSPESSAAPTAGRTTEKSLIPAAQTMVVPMVVQIDKKTIIEILKEDIKSISRSESLILLETVGITQTAFGIQSLPSRNEQG